MAGVIAMASLTVHRADGKAAEVSVAQINALLAGRFDNPAQVAQGRDQHPPPQHVTITIEPTGQPDWQLWRVHMDVEPEIADAAGSDTSLDAVWAMNIAPSSRGMELVPYTLKPSVDAAALQAAAFDPTQWLALAACAMSGEFSASKVLVEVPPDEMCVAATMGLGGKRAFLPTWVARQGDGLEVQIVYFGRPWKVDAHRVGAS
jgi:hypothetical protein